jgi:hypothetical protein
MVANGTLIKVKDTYTLIDAETIKQTIKPLKEIIEQTIEPSKETIEQTIKKTTKKTINSIKQTSKPSNETIKTIKQTIKTSNEVKHIGTGGNLHQTIKNRTSETKHIVNKGKNQQTMNKRTMHEQPMAEQQMMNFYVFGLKINFQFHILHVNNHHPCLDRQVCPKHRQVVYEYAIRQYSRFDRENYQIFHQLYGFYHPIPKHQKYSHLLFFQYFLHWISPSYKSMIK